MGNCFAKSKDMEKKVYKIVMISGSLRKASTNTGLLKAIQKSGHSGFTFEEVDITEFPIFNQDVEEKGVPAPIAKARKQVEQADAIIFGVPQYNFSISAPLKNAYDWLSREYPNDPSPVQQKIGAMVSSGGGMGGSKAQNHFNDSVKFRKMKMLYDTLDDSKKIQVKRFSPGIFDEKGNLIDAETHQKLKNFLDEFHGWIQKNKK